MTRLCARCLRPAQALGRVYAVRSQDGAVGLLAYCDCCAPPGTSAEDAGKEYPPQRTITRALRHPSQYFATNYGADMGKAELAIAMLQSRYAGDLIEALGWRCVRTAQ